MHDDAVTGEFAFAGLDAEQAHAAVGALVALAELDIGSVSV
ncbi:MAG: hypothetical protein QF554_00355 [Dehalococcoidia bacterium]|nr:hypothetical protein [Dehalococcoidia bacterium]